MVSNPMQRKARTSFLLGMFLAIVIMGAVVGYLLYLIKGYKDEQDSIRKSQKEVCVLSADVNSGDSITSGSLTKVVAMADSVPSDAITASALTEKSVAKVNLKKGTIITSALIQDSDDKTTNNDVRIQEYNMLKISSQIKTGDYIDVRLRLPSGLDYIVVSKKKVEVPQIAGVDSENTIWVNMTEDETLLMSEAIVETYTMKGAILYTTSYVEPGMQNAATPTYVATESVVNLITNDPNVIDEAKSAVYARYQNDNIHTRSHIDGEISKNAEDASDNVETGVSTEVSTTKEQRQAYLDALSGN